MKNIAVDQWNFTVCFLYYSSPLQKPDLLEEPGNNRPVVPVTFVFTTNNPSAAQFDNFTQMRKEISILNKYYLDDQGKKIFNFKLNRYIPYKEFSKLHCDLKQQINQPYPISTETIPASVNTCFPKRTASKEVIVLFMMPTQQNGNLKMLQVEHFVIMANLLFY